MNRGTSIAVIVLVAALLAVAYLLRPACYAGRPLSEWLLASRTNATSGEALMALRQAPPDKLIPLLSTWMTAHDSRTMVRLRELLGRQHLVQFHFVSAHDKRSAAYRGVVILGPKAKPLLPQLQVALGSSEPMDVFDGAFALCTIGAEATNILFKALTNESRQASAARQGAWQLLASTEFNAALHNWPAQSAENLARLRCLFNLKCLHAVSANYQRSRGGVTNLPFSRPASIRPRNPRAAPPPIMPGTPVYQYE